MNRALVILTAAAGLLAGDSRFVQISEALAPSVAEPAPSDDPFGPPAVATPPSRVPPKRTTSDKPNDGELRNKVDATTEPMPIIKKTFPPGTVRVHLHDGSMITGIFADKTIEVETEFGVLKVPLDQITSLTPGLDSQTGRMEMLKKLIEELGDKSYSVRDKAEKKLMLMGAKIREELERNRRDENAERRTRVQKILAAIDELEEDGPSIGEGNGDSQPWRRLDTVVTQQFTLAGQIKQKEFELVSKYGKLKISLADIRRVERPSTARSSYRRSVEVAGTNIAPRQYKNSHIVVQAGDRVSIRADGVLKMTPWGSSAMSTPDGAPNYGWYINAKIPSGALVMRIGSKGTPTKVGSRHTFTATKAGTLYFAIGMNASQANSSFPGTYKLKVSVQPAGK